MLNLFWRMSSLFPSRLTASSSATQWSAFFFTDTDGSLQRSDSVAKVSQLMGMTSCFRSPTSVCSWNGTGASTISKVICEPTRRTGGIWITRIVRIKIKNFFITCSADFLTFVFESLTRRRRRARFSLAVFKMYNSHHNYLNTFHVCINVTTWGDFFYFTIRARDIGTADLHCPERQSPVSFLSLLGTGNS